MGRSENRRKKKLLLLTSTLCLPPDEAENVRVVLENAWITRRYERNIRNTQVCEVQMEDESEFRSMFRMNK